MKPAARLSNHLLIAQKRSASPDAGSHREKSRFSPLQDLDRCGMESRWLPSYDAR